MNSPLSYLKLYSPASTIPLSSNLLFFPPLRFSQTGIFLLVHFHYDSYLFAYLFSC